MMHIVWDGTTLRPGGRYLHADEFEQRPPPPLTIPPRGHVQSPRPLPMEPDPPERRSPRTIARETRTAHVRKALRTRPHTESELAKLIGLPADRARNFLYQMTYKRLIVPLGTQPLAEASWTRRTERIYGLGPRSAR
jgi:hypothetical protein